MSRDKIVLFIVSLFLGLLLWLQVDTQREPGKQRELSVRVEARNVPNETMITRGPKTVKVIAEGTSDQLDKVSADQITAFVDFEKGKAGVAKYQVQLTAPKLAVPIRLQRGIEQFELSRVIRRVYKVTVEPRGVSPGDLRFEGASSDPETIEVTGPEQAIASVNFVRAMLDLSKIRPGETYPAKVEILDSAGRPVLLATSNPEDVTIRPAIAAAPASNRLLITPTWRGQPDFGFEVKSYEIKPSQVEATGPPAVLARIQRIETEPIDLTGVRVTKTVEVRLKKPGGLSFKSSDRVRVTLVIGASAASPSLPESTPP